MLAMVNDIMSDIGWVTCCIIALILICLLYVWVFDFVKKVKEYSLGEIYKNEAKKYLQAMEREREEHAKKVKELKDEIVTLKARHGYRDDYTAESLERDHGNSN